MYFATEVPRFLAPSSYHGEYSKQLHTSQALEARCLINRESRQLQFSSQLVDQAGSLALGLFSLTS